MTSFLVRYLLSLCMGLKLIFHINPNNFDHKIRSFPSHKHCDSFMNQGVPRGVGGSVGLVIQGSAGNLKKLFI